MDAQKKIGQQYQCSNGVFHLWDHVGAQSWLKAGLQVVSVGPKTRVAKTGKQFHYGFQIGMNKHSCFAHPVQLLETIFFPISRTKESSNISKYEPIFLIELNQTSNQGSKLTWYAMMWPLCFILYHHNKTYFNHSVSLKLVS